MLLEIGISPNFVMQSSDSALFPISIEDSANYYDQEARASKNKTAELADSYKSMNVLLALSKLFKKFLFPKLSTIIKKPKLIPNHQFGFDVSTQL